MLGWKQASWVVAEGVTGQSYPVCQSGGNAAPHEVERSVGSCRAFGLHLLLATATVLTLRLSVNSVSLPFDQPADPASHVSRFAR